MNATTTRRQELLEMKSLLAKGSLNWTDGEIHRIAAFTSISEADLTMMRHKMRRASEWSARNLAALEEVIRRSENPNRLRKLVEVKATVEDALETSKTFTGLFRRVKEQIDLIDEELKRARSKGPWTRRLTAR